MKGFGYLVVSRKGGGETKFQISKSCIIGREQGCDIRVQLPTVSRQHAELTISESSEVILFNRSASNKTRVNEREIDVDDMVVLCHGDLVNVGNRTFRFDSEGNTSKELDNEKNVQHSQYTIPDIGDENAAPNGQLLASSTGSAPKKSPGDGSLKNNSSPAIEDKRNSLTSNPLSTCSSRIECDQVLSIAQDEDGLLGKSANELYDLFGPPNQNQEGQFDETAKELCDLVESGTFHTPNLSLADDSAQTFNFLETKRILANGIQAMILKKETRLANPILPGNMPCNIAGNVVNVIENTRLHQLDTMIDGRRALPFDLKRMIENRRFSTSSPSIIPEIAQNCGAHNKTESVPKSVPDQAQERKKLPDLLQQMIKQRRQSTAAHTELAQSKSQNNGEPQITQPCVPNVQVKHKSLPTPLKHMIRDHPLAVNGSNHVHETQKIEKMASSNVSPRTEQNTEGHLNCSLDVNDKHNVCLEPKRELPASLKMMINRRRLSYIHHEQEKETPPIITEELSSACTKSGFVQHQETQPVLCVDISDSHPQRKFPAALKALIEKRRRSSYNPIEQEHSNPSCNGTSKPLNFAACTSSSQDIKPTPETRTCDENLNQLFSNEGTFDNSWSGSHDTCIAEADHKRSVKKRLPSVEGAITLKGLNCSDDSLCVMSNQVSSSNKNSPDGRSQPDISEEQLFQAMWRLFSTPKNRPRNQTRVSLGDVSSSFQALFFDESDTFTVDESSSDEINENKMSSDTICTSSHADLIENARKNMLAAKELVQFFSKELQTKASVPSIVASGIALDRYLVDKDNFVCEMLERSQAENDSSHTYGSEFPEQTIQTLKFMAPYDMKLILEYSEEIKADAGVSDALAFGVALDTFCADPSKFREMMYSSKHSAKLQKRPRMSLGNMSNAFWKLFSHSAPTVEERSLSRKSLGDISDSICRLFKNMENETDELLEDVDMEVTAASEQLVDMDVNSASGQLQLEQELVNMEVNAASEQLEIAIPRQRRVSTENACKAMWHMFGSPSDKPAEVGRTSILKDLAEEFSAAASKIPKEQSISNHMSVELDVHQAVLDVLGNANAHFSEENEDLETCVEIFSTELQENNNVPTIVASAVAMEACMLGKETFVDDLAEIPRVSNGLINCNEVEKTTEVMPPHDMALVLEYADEIQEIKNVSAWVAFGVALEAYCVNPVTFRAERFKGKRILKGRESSTILSVPQFLPSEFWNIFQSPSSKQTKRKSLGDISDSISQLFDEENHLKKSPPFKEANSVCANFGQTRKSLGKCLPLNEVMWHLFTTPTADMSVSTSFEFIHDQVLPSAGTVNSNIVAESVCLPFSPANKLGLSQVKTAELFNYDKFLVECYANELINTACIAPSIAYGIALDQYLGDKEQFVAEMSARPAADECFAQPNHKTCTDSKTNPHQFLLPNDTQLILEYAEEIKADAGISDAIAFGVAQDAFNADVSNFRDLMYSSKRSAKQKFRSRKSVGNMSSAFWKLFGDSDESTKKNSNRKSLEDMSESLRNLFLGLESHDTEDILKVTPHSPIEHFKPNAHFSKTKVSRRVSTGNICQAMFHLFSTPIEKPVRKSVGGNSFSVLEQLALEFSSASSEIPQQRSPIIQSTDAELDVQQAVLNVLGNEQSFLTVKEKIDENLQTQVEMLAEDIQQAHNVSSIVAAAVAMEACMLDTKVFLKQAGDLSDKLENDTAKSKDCTQIQDVLSPHDMALVLEYAQEIQESKNVSDWVAFGVALEAYCECTETFRAERYQQKRSLMGRELKTVPSTELIPTEFWHLFQSPSYKPTNRKSLGDMSDSISHLFNESKHPSDASFPLRCENSPVGAPRTSRGERLSVNNVQDGMWELFASPKSSKDGNLSILSLSAMSASNSSKEFRDDQNSSATSVEVSVIPQCVDLHLTVSHMLTQERSTKSTESISSDKKLVEMYAKELEDKAGISSSLAYGVALDQYLGDKKKFVSEMECHQPACTSEPNNFDQHNNDEVDPGASLKPPHLNTRDMQLILDYANEIKADAGISDALAFGVALDTFCADVVTFRTQMYSKQHQTKLQSRSRKSLGDMSSCFWKLFGNPVDKDTHKPRKSLGDISQSLNTLFNSDDLGEESHFTNSLTSDSVDNRSVEPFPLPKVPCHHLAAHDMQLVLDYAEEIKADAGVSDALAFGVALDTFCADIPTFRTQMYSKTRQIKRSCKSLGNMSHCFWKLFENEMDKETTHKPRSSLGDISQSLHKLFSSNDFDEEFHSTNSLTCVTQSPVREKHVSVANACQAMWKLFGSPQSSHSDQKMHSGSNLKQLSEEFHNAASGICHTEKELSCCSDIDIYKPIINVLGSTQINDSDHEIQASIELECCVEMFAEDLKSKANISSVVASAVAMETCMLDHKTFVEQVVELPSIQSMTVPEENKNIVKDEMPVHDIALVLECASEIQDKDRVSDWVAFGLALEAYCDDVVMFRQQRHEKMRHLKGRDQKNNGNFEQTLPDEFWDLFENSEQESLTENIKLLPKTFNNSLSSDSIAIANSNTIVISDPAVLKVMQKSDQQNESQAQLCLMMGDSQNCSSESDENLMMQGSQSCSPAIVKFIQSPFSENSKDEFSICNNTPRHRVSTSNACQAMWQLFCTPNPSSPEHVSSIMCDADAAQSKLMALAQEFSKAAEKASPEENVEIPHECLLDLHGSVVKVIRSDNAKPHDHYPEDMEICAEIFSEELQKSTCASAVVASAVAIETCLMDTNEFVDRLSELPLTADASVYHTASNQCSSAPAELPPHDMALVLEYANEVQQEKSVSEIVAFGIALEEYCQDVSHFRSTMYEKKRLRKEFARSKKSLGNLSSSLWKLFGSSSASTVQNCRKSLGDLTESLQVLFGSDDPEHTDSTNCGTPSSLSCHVSTSNACQAMWEMFSSPHLLRSARKSLILKPVLKQLEDEFSFAARSEPYAAPVAGAEIDLHRTVIDVLGKDRLNVDDDNESCIEIFAETLHEKTNAPVTVASALAIEAFMTNQETFADQLAALPNMQTRQMDCKDTEVPSVSLPAHDMALILEYAQEVQKSRNVSEWVAFGISLESYCLDVDKFRSTRFQQKRSLLHRGENTAYVDPMPADLCRLFRSPSVVADRERSRNRRSLCEISDSLVHLFGPADDDKSESSSGKRRVLRSCSSVAPLSQYSEQTTLPGLEKQSNENRKKNVRQSVGYIEKSNLGEMENHSNEKRKKYGRQSVGCSSYLDDKQQNSCEKGTSETGLSRKSDVAMQKPKTLISSEGCKGLLPVILEEESSHRTSTKRRNQRGSDKQDVENSSCSPKLAAPLEESMNSLSARCRSHFVEHSTTAVLTTLGEDAVVPGGKQEVAANECNLRNDVKKTNGKVCKKQQKTHKKFNPCNTEFSFQSENVLSRKRKQDQEQNTVTDMFPENNNQHKKQCCKSVNTEPKIESLTTEAISTMNGNLELYQDFSALKFSVGSERTNFSEISKTTGRFTRSKKPANSAELLKMIGRVTRSKNVVNNSRTKTESTAIPVLAAPNANLQLLECIPTVSETKKSEQSKCKEVPKKHVLTTSKINTNTEIHCSDTPPSLMDSEPLTKRSLRKRTLENKTVSSKPTLDVETVPVCEVPVSPSGGVVLASIKNPSDFKAKSEPKKPQRTKPDCIQEQDAGERRKTRNASKSDGLTELNCTFNKDVVNKCFDAPAIMPHAQNLNKKKAGKPAIICQTVSLGGSKINADDLTIEGDEAKSSVPLVSIIPAKKRNHDSVTHTPAVIEMSEEPQKRETRSCLAKKCSITSNQTEDSDHKTARCKSNGYKKPKDTFKETTVEVQAELNPAIFNAINDQKIINGKEKSDNYAASREGPSSSPKNLLASDAAHVLNTKETPNILLTKSKKGKRVRGQSPAMIIVTEATETAVSTRAKSRRNGAITEEMHAMQVFEAEVLQENEQNQKETVEGSTQEKQSFQTRTAKFTTGVSNVSDKEPARKEKKAKTLQTSVDFEVLEKEKNIHNTNEAQSIRSTRSRAAQNANNCSFERLTRSKANKS